MSLRLLIIATVISLPIFGQTTVYHPFPDSNAIWNVTYSQQPCSTVITGEYSYFFGGDTIINSNTYHTVYKDGITYTFSCYNGAPLGYKGCIRQDTTLKKVFIVLAGDANEKVLYDFNLNNLGDTVNMLCGLTCPSYYHVTGIDSILIDGTYRKEYWYDCAPSLNQNGCLIEGIGKTTGLLEDCIWGFGVGSSLECFSQNNRTIFPDTTTDCELVTSVNNFILNASSINIFPNPFQTSSTLSLNSHFENSELNIYNTFGVQVKRQKIISQTTIINRYGLPDGIYFYQVTNGKSHVTSGKFIIQ